MNPDPSDTPQAVRAAWQALRQGDRSAARRWAEMAAERSPELEEPWLILAALGTPQESISYLEKALKINPASESARKAMQWAKDRLPAETHVHTLPKPAAVEQALPAAAAPKPAPAVRVIHAPTPAKKPAPDRREESPRPQGSAPSAAETQPKPRTSAPTRKPHLGRWLAGTLILLILCAVAGWFLLSGGVTPALAFINDLDDSLRATATLPGAPVDLAKPTYTPSATPTATFTPTSTPTNTPTFTPTFTPTNTPTETPIPTDTPIPSPTPIVTDTPIPPPPVYTGVACLDRSEERWIDVDLGDQMLYACEYNTTVGSFLVSTGTYQYPTVTGDFNVYLRFLSTRMTGPGYDLPNVPYTMYFYKGYGIHGTYWHSNFGTPMSHGCINMRTPDAEWVYYWSSMGTLVHVHY